MMSGLLLQAYYIFSIGNIKPMITAEYPDCWKYHKGGCTFSLVNTPEYTQIIGAPRTRVFAMSSQSSAHACLNNQSELLL